jgi:hypothetical protein
MNRLPPVTSSSTILVTVTWPIRHFCIAHPRLPAPRSLAGKLSRAETARASAADNKHYS